MSAATDTVEQRSNLFKRVVCGIDGSAAAAEAARELALLAPADSVLHLLSAVNPGAAAPAGVAVTQSLRELEDEAADRLSRAGADLPSTRRWDSRVVVGQEIEAICADLQRIGATLVAVGGSPPHRLAGAVLGSVASALLHEAPCSVLVARGIANAEEFPRTVQVGLDGSEGAARALACACELRDRLGADLRAVAVDEDGHLDRQAAQEAAAEREVELEQIDGPVVDSLVEAAPDLLVVGSRGLRGLRALGSVSERVAHRSRSSVLVVR